MTILSPGNRVNHCAHPGLGERNKCRNILGHTNILPTFTLADCVLKSFNFFGLEYKISKLERIRIPHMCDMT